MEVGGLLGPSPQHPERVEDDGHPGQPHDGVGRLERRLHAAPHRRTPRHDRPPAAEQGEIKKRPPLSAFARVLGCVGEKG